jgi:hypothetical protein
VPAEDPTGDIRVRRVDGGAVVKNSAATAGSVDPYTATGELEVGVPQGTAAWLDARSSTGRVRNHLHAPGAPEQSGRSVKVRARSHGGGIIVRCA